MQEPSSQPAAEAAVTNVTKPKGLSSADILTRVAAAIVATAPKVIDSVIETMRAKELERRAAALLGGIELGIITRAALKKAQKPDKEPEIFDAKGKPIGEVGYTKPRLAEIKKLIEKLAKIEKAIDGGTRDYVPEVPETPAVGVEGQEGYVAAIKGKPAVEPDFGALYNLKAELEKAEKAASAESTE